MLNIEELLAQRYGGARFNPAAGQTQMSLQEWIDRHPALAGKPLAVLKDKYINATQMGQPYTGAQNPTRPEFGMQAVNNPGTQVGPGAGPGGGNAPFDVQQEVSKIKPDSPLRHQAGANKRNKGAAQRRAKKLAAPKGKANNKQSQH